MNQDFYKVLQTYTGRFTVSSMQMFDSKETALTTYLFLFPLSSLPPDTWTLVLRQLRTLCFLCCCSLSTPITAYRGCSPPLTVPTFELKHLQGMSFKTMAALWVKYFLLWFTKNVKIRKTKMLPVVL